MRPSLKHERSPRRELQDAVRLQHVPRGLRRRAHPRGHGADVVPRTDRLAAKDGRPQNQQRCESEKDNRPAAAQEVHNDLLSLHTRSSVPNF